MHERGYQYIGPTSLYKLTIPEMARLYKGWRSTQEKEQAAESGGTQNSDIERRQQYNAHSPRESDWDAYNEFRDQHGITDDG